MMKHLDALMTMAEGSVLRRADLLVHTPASPDIDPRWAEASADYLVH